MSDTNVKVWWRSKTVLGAISMLLAMIIRLAVPDAELDENEILNLLTLAMQLFGAIVALIGRFRAKEKVVMKLPKTPELGDRPPMTPMK